MLRGTGPTHQIPVRRARLAWKRLRTTPGPAAGAGILALFILLAMAAPLVARHDPVTLYPEAILQPPSWRFLLGTDELGRDILSRVIFGARISLQVGLVTVGIALGIGTFLGLLAGYYGGWSDMVVMSTMDVLLAFPQILLALAVLAVLGPSLEHAMIAVGVSAIPVYARTVRASTLAVRTQEYIDAARAVGASDAHILGKHVLPNVLAPVVVLATAGVGISILIASGLSYLGLGAQPPTPEWGAMLSEARTYLRRAWWMATFPGLAIMLVVLASNLLGDWLRDVLDPRVSV